MHSDVSSYVWDLSETIARLLAGFLFKIFLEIQHFAKHKIMLFFGTGCRIDRSNDRFTKKETRESLDKWGLFRYFQRI